MKKVLIIGAGRIAGLNEFDNYRLKPCTHIGGFNNHHNFNVEGICDIDLNKANDFASKFKLNYSFDNISLALKKIKPHLVTIAVPYNFNYEIIQKLSNDIKDIIIEWESFCNHLGISVKFHDFNDMVNGQFIGLNQNGDAKIDFNGEEMVINSGIIEI